MFVTVANEFDWKVLNPQALEETIDIPGRRNVRRRHLAYLSVEITLTERLPYRDEERVRTLLKGPTVGKCHPFKDIAFRPKTYTLRLDLGRFILPWGDDQGGPLEFPYAYEYGLRLVFDKSPYPPPPEWERPDQSGYIWRWREFVSVKKGLYHNTWFGGCISI